MHRHIAFGSHNPYPSPTQTSKLPSIRQTGLLDSPISRHASPLMPRQMLTPPGSAEIDSLSHHFTKAELDEGYDTSDDAEPHHESLFPSSPHLLHGAYGYNTSRQHLSVPTGNPKLPSLETLIDFHIRHRDNARFEEARVSPPQEDHYRIMGNFVNQTAQLRVTDSASPVSAPRPLTGHKRSSNEFVPVHPSSWSVHSHPMRRENTSSTVEDHDPDYAPHASPRKRRSVGPTRRHVDTEYAEPPRRSHARTSSKSSNKSTPVAKNARAQKSKVQKSDRFEDYPEFTPSPSTMVDAMEAANSVKDWNGSSINVLEDPDRDKLSRAEQIVAQRLHLPCSKYLCVKRQIFEEFIKWHRHEQEKQTPNWNKTTAQGAVNCDVTKASELYLFFQKVGWFKEELYRHIIDRPRGAVRYSSQGIAA